MTRHLKTVLAIVSISLTAMFAGCASPDYPSVPQYNKYSVEEVLKMVKAGESSELIIRKLQAANGFYPLSASEIVKLHDQGMPLALLDYMHQTYMHQVRRDERFQLPQRFGSTY